MMHNHQLWYRFGMRKTAFIMALLAVLVCVPLAGAKDKDKKERFQLPGPVKLDHEGEKLVAIPGVPPNMAKLPAGCPFSERCPFVMDICSSQRPPLGPSIADPMVLRACHRPVAEVAREAEQVLS